MTMQSYRRQCGNIYINKSVSGKRKIWQRCATDVYIVHISIPLLYTRHPVVKLTLESGMSKVTERQSQLSL